MSTPRDPSGEAQTREIHVERTHVASPEPAPPAPPAAEPVAPPMAEEHVVVQEHETLTERGDGVVHRDSVALERRRRRPLDPVAVAVGTLLVLLALGAAAWWYFSQADEQEVPSVRGLTESEATARLEADGFVVDVSRTASEQPSSTVIDQSPEAGEEVDDGSTVQLTVSSGPARVDVPNAVGLTEAAARDRMVSAGFEVTSREEFAERPAGTVVRQEPEAGAEAEPGSQVVLVVSKGSGRVDVPSVVGLTRADAEAQLSEVELEANVVEVPSDEPEGTVVAQSPTGGQATKGDTVRLNVSAGR